MIALSCERWSGRLEGLVADGGLRHDGLDEPGSVAHLQKVNLAARSAVGEPAPDRDGSGLRAVRCLRCRRPWRQEGRLFFEREGRVQVIQYGLNPARARQPMRPRVGARISVVRHLEHERPAVANLRKAVSGRGPVDACRRTGRDGRRSCRGCRGGGSSRCSPTAVRSRRARHPSGGRAPRPGTRPVDPSSRSPSSQSSTALGGRKLVGDDLQRQLDAGRRHRPRRSVRGSGGRPLASLSLAGMGCP